MTERGMRIWIGVFVLGSLLLLGVLIILFGSAPNLFKRTRQYTVRFNVATGLNPGSPVRRSGVRIGEVKSVDLDEEEGDVRVTLAIDPRYTIRKSEQPVLSTGLLGNDSSIDFVSKPKPEVGQPPLDRSPVEADEVMKGTRQASVSTVLNQASGVVPAAQEALNDVRKSMQRIEKAIPLFEQTLDEFQKLAQAGREWIPEARQVTRELNELTKDVRKAVPNVTRTADEVSDLAQDLRKALPGFTKTSDEIRELAKSAREVVPEIRKLSDDAGAALRSWQRVGERLDVLIASNADRVTKVLDNLNDALTRVASALSDSNQTNIAEILRNVRLGSANLDSISRNVDDITREGRTSVRRLNTTLSQTELTMKTLQNALNDFQGATNSQGGRIGSIVKNLDESMDKLNRVMDDIRQVVRVIGQSDGTLNRFITDPSLYNNLDQAVALIPKIMPRLERIVKDFEVFANKLAAHPELLGIRGAIHPDAGLTTPPPIHPNTSFYPPPTPGPHK
jgi:phospholipid/cholesterol/gamma-HCH transport system substrate-binding protein